MKLNESIWDTSEERPSALILVLDKQGKILGDRVFPDARSRRIFKIVEVAHGRFMGVGSALGERGWLLGFRLGDRA